MSTKVKIENVVKIFGDEPDGEALTLLRAGYSKDVIRESTGHVVGVSNANIDISEGEIFVVMGLSGSGKSTLIRCVNRLHEPTAGRVFVDDTDITALELKELQAFRRDSTGMVFQHFALFPHKDIRSNVAFGLKVKGLDVDGRNATAERALALVGLSGYESSYPRQLSGGMQQRVGLARALATDPDILLMDEAFSALDPLIRRQMQDELMAIQDQLHKTILFITHDLNEALRVGSRVCIMKDGAIHQIGTPEDILMRPETDYVAEFVQDVDQGRVLAVETVREDAAAIAEDASVAEVLSAIDRLGVEAAHVVDADRSRASQNNSSSPRRRAPRNKPDEVLDAVAARGGVIGCTLYPLFMGGADVPRQEYSAMIARQMPARSQTFPNGLRGFGAPGTSHRSPPASTTPGSRPPNASPTTSRSQKSITARQCARSARRLRSMRSRLRRGWPRLARSRQPSSRRAMAASHRPRSNQACRWQRSQGPFSRVWNGAWLPPELTPMPGATRQWAPSSCA
ncbi:quaternary amine ABC transporter ATP-binding protein [Candidatus Poriferisodalis sp.]|uniref:quaternary amine ABC transporter ATP-binding protein n=1 Tax=Candidatus Poriferisodalis sp. TaxID=3101277 RepID=UPI003C6F2A65